MLESPVRIAACCLEKLSVGVGEEDVVLAAVRSVELLAVRFGTQSPEKHSWFLVQQLSPQDISSDLTPARKLVGDPSKPPK